ncbi:FAD-dependent oxidoreductase [Microbacterium deminutum]|uniref:NAD(P)/FAD-dependent oxidoreductase n=1 Tax=Microbacterium deminutum TaxID=344164 RepID=A0ABP5BEL3_9MICO
MKIGIIGGGAAGLTSAWLLADQHDVTLFEAEDRLGGHAHTIDVETDGRRIEIDAGFQFFGGGQSYRRFNRLLDALNVARSSYPATLTVFDARDQHAVVLPPFRDGRPVQSSLTPSAIGSMLRFRRFLARIPAFLGQHDKTITIEDYLAQERMPKAFVDRFLYPLLLSFWCVELSEFRGFAAYNALYYLGANMPSGLTPPPQSEVAGGLKVYIDALANGIGREGIRLDAGIRRIDQEGDGYSIVDSHGRRDTFDHLVLATNARQALALIESIPVLDTRSEQLRRFRYFDTTIAIHGDRRLMPRDERAWSVVNARWDGRHSSLSIWSPARGLPIFKSWITFDEAMPEPLHAIATYQHGMIDLEYFDAQQRLKLLQGQHRLWLAGLYADDADSHESAIRSAMTVARSLAPHSRRLKLLESP